MKKKRAAVNNDQDNHDLGNLNSTGWGSQKVIIMSTDDDSDNIIMINNINKPVTVIQCSGSRFLA